MTNVSSLIGRIDAEFTTAGERATSLQARQLQAYGDRKKRREFAKNLLDQVREDWRPRLDVLVHRLPDRVTVTPQSTPNGWEVTLVFRPDLARVRLKFAASMDLEGCTLFFDYDLEVIPVFLRFAPLARLECAADSLDLTATGRWMDDRIIDFVQVYLSLQENDQYLREHLVEDPIAHMWFPKFAAAATLQQNGQTYYFFAEETRQEFENQLREPPLPDRPPRSRETEYFPAQSALVL